MCFSATGSFVASAMLTSAGAISLATNRGTAQGTRMLSLMPLLFAIQQSAEGVVWLTIGQSRASGLHIASAYLFLGFALVLWPSWVPVALLRAEAHPTRRRRLKRLASLGVGVSIMGAVLLVHGRPTAHIADHSIHYDYGVPGGAWRQGAYLFAYLLPAVIPFFVAGLPLGRSIGAVYLVALITTLIIKQGALASVWCFFSSLISVLIVLSVRRVCAPTRAAVPALTPG